MVKYELWAVYSGKSYHDRRWNHGCPNDMSTVNGILDKYVSSNSLQSYNLIFTESMDTRDMYLGLEQALAVTHWKHTHMIIFVFV